MAKLKAMAPVLAGLAPKTAWLGPRTEADMDRQRNQTRLGRKLYHTAAWKRLSWQVRFEALFTCVRCGANHADRPGLLVADHIVPHRDDPALFWDRANLQCLCKACHDGQKQSEERHLTPRP